MADSHHNHHGRRNYKKKDFKKKDREKAPKLKEINLTDEELKASPFGMLGLSPKVVKSTIDMGYTEPTPVQAQAIPQVLAHHDVMAAAQTGTGKTAAFLLPALDMLPHTEKGQGPLMLVVTPTRELAQQIEAVAKSVCARTNHKAATVVGGVSYNPQRSALQRGCDLLVATPGRLIDLMNQGACHLDQVQMLVLDEADRMLDMGFLPDMQRIVSETPKDRQTLLFSATLDKSVLDHTRSLVNDPVSIEIARKGTTAETVEQYVIGTEHLAKASLLVQLLKQEGYKRVIVFTNSKHRCDTICTKLEKSGIRCATIHGDRSQAQRMNALRRFAKGEVDVLVATDVLARGIDVPDVSYVVNFDVPFDDPEDYIHRIGRTGRAGEEGWAVTFVTSEDYLCLRAVEQLMGRIVPDFPRADSLDRGENPFQPDPDRSPDEKLPSAKALRRMVKRGKKRAEKSGRKGGKGGRCGDGKHGKKHDKDVEGSSSKRKNKHDEKNDQIGGKDGNDSRDSQRSDDKRNTAQSESRPMNRAERRAKLQRNSNAFGSFKDDRGGKHDKRKRGGKRDDFYGDRDDRGSRSDRFGRDDRNDRKRGGKRGGRDFDDDRSNGRRDDRRYDDRHDQRRNDRDDNRYGNRSDDRYSNRNGNRYQGDSKRGGRNGRDGQRNDWRSEYSRGNDRHDSRGKKGGNDRYDDRDSYKRGGNGKPARKHDGSRVRVVNMRGEAVYRPAKSHNRSSRHPGDRGGYRH